MKSIIVTEIAKEIKFKGFWDKLEPKNKVSGNNKSQKNLRLTLVFM